MLIGREKELMPLIGECLKPLRAQYLSTWAGPSSVARVLVKNYSSATFILRNKSSFTFHNEGEVIFIGPHAIAEIKVKTIESLTSFKLKFEVLSAVTAPRTHPVVELLFEITE
jgi:hypothetical protein